MSHYNMNIGYPTSNSRGGQPDAPATTRAYAQPLPPPPPIRAPPPPSAPPVIPPMPRQPRGIMPPAMRHEQLLAQAPAPAPPPRAPNLNTGPYTFVPVQHGPPRQPQPRVPANPPRQAHPPPPANPSYLTYTPIPPRDVAPPPQSALLAYDCPHQDCMRRVMVTSVREHMWRQAWHSAMKYCSAEKREDVWNVLEME